MRKPKGLSIRKKLLYCMIGFSVIPVLIVTAVAQHIMYNSMRDQLIYNHTMSVRWLQDRLDTEIRNITDQFYKIEVNKEVKADILDWCLSGEEPDYAAKWRMISALNSVISLDMNINSIELYNLYNDTVLIAERSGSSWSTSEERLFYWKNREPTLQTNIVFSRSDKEILVTHQINRFEDSKPLALVVLHLRPYNIQDVLENIKISPDESIMIFNDMNELIESDYGTGAGFEDDYISDMLSYFRETDARDTARDGNFWFYRSVGGGKLQILLSVPDKTIVTALNKTLMGGLIAAAISLITSIGCSILFSQIISKPIINLSSKMRTTILDGSASRDPVVRQDEIGVLQESFGIMIARNQDLIAQEFKSKIEKRNAQIRALQAQINPHFMYNTLQAIGGMALKKDAPEIYTVTLALSDIMRYSLNFSKEMVTLREEIKYLESYLSIQNRRFGDRISLKIEAEDVMDYLIPKLILQPLIENSFEHGLMNKPGDWIIKLKGTMTNDNDLILEVKDNGRGISPEKLEKIRKELENNAEEALGTAAHIGLCNVNSRVKLKFPGEQYGISISSIEGEGTIVQVRMKAVKEDGVGNGI